jgi:hypothetical protein
VTNKQLVEVLVKCFMSDKFHSVYKGRWDVWLLQHGHMLEAAHLRAKTSDQLAKIVYEAECEAGRIKTSPLYEALKFEL